MNNSQLILLDSILKNTQATFFPKEIRADLFKLSNHIESDVKKYYADRTIIYLLNESVEKEVNGQKSLQMPEFPTRERETGTDEEFKAKVLKIMAIRNKIESEIEALNKTKVDIKIERILTDEEFDKIAADLQLPLDWESLRVVLVKK